MVVRCGTIVDSFLPSKSQQFKEILSIDKHRKAVTPFKAFCWCENLLSMFASLKIEAKKR